MLFISYKQRRQIGVSSRSRNHEPLTRERVVKIILSPVTWLPAFAYLTTFGLELALDGAMANTLFSLFSKRRAGFDQDTAGYYTSIL